MGVNNSGCVTTPWTSGNAVVVTTAAVVYGFVMRLTNGGAVSDRWAFHDSTSTAVSNRVLLLANTGNTLSTQQYMLETPISFKTGVMVTITGTASDLYAVLYK